MITFENGADFLASLPSMFLFLIVVFSLAGIGGDNYVSR